MVLGVAGERGRRKGLAALPRLNTHTALLKGNDNRHDSLLRMAKCFFLLVVAIWVATNSAPRLLWVVESDREPVLIGVL